jgi:Flp pilus assembly protein TadD
VVTGCELDPPREIAGLDRCLALNPGDIELMLDLGSRLEMGHELGRVEQLYRQALSVDPKDADVHARLARVLLERGDRAAAAREAREALAFQPQSPTALDLLGRAGEGGTK